MSYLPCTVAAGGKIWPSAEVRSQADFAFIWKCIHRSLSVRTCRYYSTDRVRVAIGLMAMMWRGRSRPSLLNAVAVVGTADVAFDCVDEGIQAFLGDLLRFIGCPLGFHELQHFFIQARNSGIFQLHRVS